MRTLIWVGLLFVLPAPALGGRIVGAVVYGTITTGGGALVEIGYVDLTAMSIGTHAPAVGTAVTSYSEISTLGVAWWGSGRRCAAYAHHAAALRVTSGASSDKICAVKFIVAGG